MLIFLGITEIAKANIDPGVWVPGKFISGGTYWTDYDKGHQTTKEKCDSYCIGQSNIGVETNYYC